MISRTTRRFREAFAKLPERVRKHSQDAYRALIDNPQHPSLRFKKVHTSEPVYSVRISRDYRAVGVLTDDEIVWFWIGSHSDYENLLKQL